jgi:hypothetical protein
MFAPEVLGGRVDVLCERSDDRRFFEVSVFVPCVSPYGGSTTFPVLTRSVVDDFGRLVPVENCLPECAL